jgi:two-component system vancomycin resistance associated response regulator VraR
MPLKIVLADSYKIALLGMEDMIRSIRDFEVVGFFTNRAEVMECLNNNKVDIVVINLMLKGTKDYGIIGDMKKTQDDIKIIVLADIQDDLVTQRAIELGASAVIGKDTSYSELISIILNVANGNDIYPDTVMQKFKKSLLSDMEQRVLELIADEYTNEEISKELYISRRTVESYVSNICEKLGSANRVGAVRKAMELGLLN